MGINEFIAAITHPGARSERLLQYLYDLQQQFGHVPPAGISLLAERLTLSETHIRCVCSFYSFLNTGPPLHYDIHFGDSELSMEDRAASICPVGAILPRREAFL